MLQFRFQWKWGHPKKNSLYFTFLVVWDLLFSANEQNIWMKHDETKCLSSSYKTTGTIQQAYHSRALWYSDTLANTTTTTSPACEETRASKTNWCQTSHWQPAANARSKEVKGQLYNQKKKECQHVCVDIFQTSRNLYPSIHLPTPAGLLFKDKHHQPCVCACWMTVNPRARKTAHGDSGTPLWRLNDLRAAKKAKAKWATPDFSTNATIPGGFWCVLQKAPRRVLFTVLHQKSVLHLWGYK